MAVEQLLEKAPTNEFDYAFLKGCLRGYKRPDAKIKSLLEKNYLLRLQRNTFAFGPAAKRGPVSRELLANMMYRPSYISLDYALAYYGLIPEKVAMVTSLSTRRNRSFQTTLGVFSYRFANKKHFSLGFTQVKIDDRRRVLMACPEKALLDKIVFDGKIKRAKDLKPYLFENLRIDEELFTNLRSSVFSEFDEVLQKNITRWILNLHLRKQSKLL